MDLATWRPGATRAFPIDFRTLDAAAENFDMTKLMHAAAQRKQKRYSGQVRPLVIDLRGPLSHESRALIEEVAAECAQCSSCGPPPAILARRWRRELEVCLAFEVAESLRAAPSDSIVESAAMRSAQNRNRRTASSATLPLPVAPRKVRFADAEAAAVAGSTQPPASSRDCGARAPLSRAAPLLPLSAARSAPPAFAELRPLSPRAAAA